MPLDTAGSFDPRPARPSQVPCLDLAERQAAANFGPQLKAALAEMPESDRPLVVLARLSSTLAGTRFRLAAQGESEAIPLPGEMAVACLPSGLPRSTAERRAVTVRLASAAAGAWRQRCQIQRLGLLAA
ncbi:hypothetical protein [Siccirubricoccus sp. G192]|uniref:hypothetical protein n=1 Tax=Siccirubricoccus sp. G192 TaxID=2849651 RepID=UPI001C2B8362|nr:hypothetical protein [Siccirubricoccus sp. G192]MBV1797599.1 hypothetical protein [Siccirubricoccus sp. G192]